MSLYTSGESSSTAGPSNISNASYDGWSDSGSSSQSVSSRGSPGPSAHTKGRFTTKGKEPEHKKPSFSRQFSPASFPEVRVAESSHRAAVKARVAKASQSNKLVRGLKYIARKVIPSEILNSVGLDQASNDGSDDFALDPPDSSTVAPSCRTFIDPDDSVWDHEVESTMGSISESEALPRTPDCDDLVSESETDYLFPSEPMFEEPSPLSKGFHDYCAEKSGFVREKTFFEYYEVALEHRTALWEKHKVWLAKRYGSAHAESIIKFCESRRFDLSSCRRVLSDTFTLREEEERYCFLQRGATVAIASLARRDLRIERVRRVRELQLQTSSDSSDVKEGRRPGRPPVSSLIERFEKYEDTWDFLQNVANMKSLSFRTVPWPTTITPRSPVDITCADIWDFVLDGHYGSTRRIPLYCRLSANEELKRWCPENFNYWILSRIEDEEEQGAVRIGADIVLKSLVALVSLAPIPTWDHLDVLHHHQLFAEAGLDKTPSTKSQQ